MKRICGDYFIDVDRYNFILTYKRGEKERRIGYYNSLQGLLKAMLRHMQRLDCATTHLTDTDEACLAQLTARLEQYDNYINKAVETISKLKPSDFCETQKTVKKVTQSETIEV